jgi:hypothetical protein
VLHLLEHGFMAFMLTLHRCCCCHASSQSFCCFHNGKWDAPINERVFPVKGQSNQYCTNSGAPYSPLQCFTTKCIDASKTSCVF